jgi:hypothetical protein
MRLGKLACWIICAALFVIGCKKSDQYSDIPAITFKSLTVQQSTAGFDSTSHLIISFTDGDGDIGSIQYEGVPNNIIIAQFSKLNGSWVNDSTDWSGHLPYLTPTGNNKALTGEIATDISLPWPKTNDTIRYSVSIIDRALHQSNSIITSEIVINTQ